MQELIDLISTVQLLDSLKASDIQKLREDFEERFKDLITDINLHNNTTLVFPNDKDFESRLVLVMQIFQDDQGINNVLDKIERQFNPEKAMLKNLVFYVEDLVRDEIQKHPSLKLSSSSAVKILQAIDEFKSLSIAEQNAKQLTILIGTIEELARSSQRSRNNVVARAFMANSSMVYQNIDRIIVNTQDRINELKNSGSSPEIQLDAQIGVKSPVMERKVALSSSSLSASQYEANLHVTPQQKLSSSLEAKEEAVRISPISKSVSPKDHALQDLSIALAPTSSPELESRKKEVRPKLQREEGVKFRQSVIRPMLNVPLQNPVKEGLQGSRQNLAFVSEAAHRQIINAIKTNYPPNVETDFQPFSSSTSKEMLQTLEHNLKICERLKHPDPNWIYTRIEPVNPEEKTIIKIKYDPNIDLRDDALNNKIKYSIITRKLSLIGGVLTLLDSPDYLTSHPGQKATIKNELAKLSQEIIASRNNNEVADPKAELDRFVVDLAASLKAITNPKPTNIIRDIREAERYFVAEHNKNQVLIVETSKDNETIVQVDIGLNHQLSLNQKNEYLTIHRGEAEQPKWYQALSKAEQDWYKQKIPHPSDSEQIKEEKWASFQLLFKSSAMPHTPGLPNSRINYLMLQRGDDVEVVNASVKSATPVSYEMPAEVQAQHSRENAQQLINTTQHLASINREHLWGDFFKQDKPPIPILVQSLLSEKVKKIGIQLSAADKHLIQGQKEAMNGLNAEGCRIMYHNDGTNAYSRGNNISMKGDPEFEQLVKVANQFLVAVYKELDQRMNVKAPDSESCLELEGEFLFFFEKGRSDEQQRRLNDFINKINVNPHLSSEQKANINIILRVLNEHLHENELSPKLSRNKAEYIVALKKLLVEAMGGAVSNNCKSGKDRTGQSEVYQHAITLFTILYSKSDELLHYSEQSPRREEFCQLSAVLNGSQKVQEAAAFNTPGSVGTKSPQISKIIDDSILREGQFKILHPLGCDLASMNKPSAFTKDEANKAQEAQKTTAITTNIKEKLHELKSEGAKSKAENTEYEESHRGISLSK